MVLFSPSPFQAGRQLSSDSTWRVLCSFSCCLNMYATDSGSDLCWTHVTWSHLSHCHFMLQKPKGYCPIYAGAIVPHHQLNWAHEVQPVYDTYAHANLQFKICTTPLHSRSLCSFWHTMFKLEATGKHCHFASSWCSNFKTQKWLQWSWTIQFQILYWYCKHTSLSLHIQMYTSAEADAPYPELNC